MKRYLALPAMALLLLACSTAAPTPGARPSPTQQPATPAPTQAPPEGFYLRAWQTQALPADATFGWLPALTVSDGLAIDGNVAIPLIYPGPLLILPQVRELSEAGQAAMAELARELDLLDGQTDFWAAEPMPGATTAHVLLIVEGVTHELSGDPNAFAGAGSPEPGTPEAFGAFWQRISYLDDWLGAELGPSAGYTPERLAVLAMLPEEPGDQLQPNVVPWPLETEFAEFGVAFPQLPEARCATVGGEELEILLPVLHEANQLTWFVDSQDEPRALVVRALLPGEPSPCPDERQPGS